MAGEGISTDEGGRVENAAVLVELTRSEIDRGVVIDVADYVSLYPSTQYYGRSGLSLPPQTP